MARKQPAVTFDQGPKERRQHNTVVVEQGANMKARLRILDQTELDRLLLARQISMDQHTTGERLYKDVELLGYWPACKWALDSNIRSESQSISEKRAEIMLKINFGRAWLLAKAGRRITEYLFGVVIGERKVSDNHLPALRLGLDRYQSFENWWHGKREEQLSVPDLIAELPGQVKRTRPFHYQE